MRAVQLVSTTGPGGLAPAELPEPPADHWLTPGSGVVIDVHAAAVGFPDLLMAHGEYQLAPELPFVLGAEVAGTVRAASPDAAVRPGQRVMAFCVRGGFAEVAVAPAHLTFALPPALSFAQGAGLILNYHTAWYALAERGRARAGETVVVHGAAGGIGTAALQIARGLGLRTIAVVSSPQKAEVARAAGADHVVDAGGGWRDEVLALGGADIVLDPVMGDRVTDGLRCLHRNGRYLILGFTGRALPAIKATRILNRDVDVIGVAWRGSVETEPGHHPAHGAAIDRLIRAGHVRPVVGAVLPLAEASRALALLDARAATGKLVLEVGGG